MGILFYTFFFYPCALLSEIRTTTANQRVHVKQYCQKTTTNYLWVPVESLRMILIIDEQLGVNFCKLKTKIWFFEVLALLTWILLLINGKA